MNIKHMGLLLGLLITGAAARAQINIDSADFAGKSNVAIIQEMKSFLKQIRAFEKMKQKMDKEGINGHSERFSPSFRLDTATALQKYRDVVYTDMYLNQNIYGDTSKLSVETQRIRSLDYEGAGFRVSLIPQKTFLYDGTVLPGSAFNEEHFDMHFGNELTTRKKTDSIQFDVVMQYTAGITSAQLSEASPEATLDGKKITLKTLNGNHAVYNYPAGLHIIQTEGINAAGRVVDDYQTSSGTGSPELQRRQIAMVSVFMDRMLAEMEKDSTMDNNAFVKKYTDKAVEATGRFENKNEPLYKEISFTSNIQSLKIYTATEKKELHTTKTIATWFADDIRADEKSGPTILYDKGGAVIFKSAEEYMQLNAYYYGNDSGYYYFNQQTKQMEQLYYFELSRLNNEYVFARKDDEEKYFILDKNNHAAEDIYFERAGIEEGVIVANKGNDVLLITGNGSKKWLRNTQVEAFENGYAVIRQNEKYGFIDTKGNILVPAQYDWAEPFSHFSDLLPGDHLFAVKKGDKYGFVDAQNKTVIPFVYDDAEPFSYGVTLVKKDGKFGLIDTRNQVLAAFESGSQSTSSNFGKRWYSLSSGGYDHYGRKKQAE